MPATNLETRLGWVVPPTPIGGLDHLGVQAPCIALYTQLLPGITNVTDRARYYAFYPWLLWQFDQRYDDRTKESCLRVLRRAECLLALIGVYHEEKRGGDERDHGALMVGRLTMRPPTHDIEATPVDLEACADKYFKNKLGGLGQYYFGPLRDLRILDYVEGNRRNPPGYDQTRGRALAEAFDQKVDGDRFFEVLEDGIVDAGMANELVSFCPCALQSNPAELEALLDLFLAKCPPWNDGAGARRRQSLALVLDAMSKARPEDKMWLGRVMRGSAYSQTLPQGEPWEVAANWERTRSGWGSYARNELFSVALQGVFWVALRLLERAGGRARSTEEIGRMVRDVALDALPSDWRTATVGEVVEALAGSLPPREEWNHRDHEIPRADRIDEATKEEELEELEVEQVANEAFTLILTLVARGLRDNPYADFDLDPSYFSPADPHLLSLRRLSEDWATMPISSWVEWVSTAWGVERHLHVALRKLRQQSRDTFRLRPLDHEVRLVDVPGAVFTNPRLAQAQQILRDLGLVKPDGVGWWELTPRGKAELEACRGA